MEFHIVSGRHTGRMIQFQCRLCPPSLYSSAVTKRRREREIENQKVVAKNVIYSSTATGHVNHSNGDPLYLFYFCLSASLLYDFCHSLLSHPIL